MNHNSILNPDSQVVKIFWTGGWDSTFRIISLAEKEIVIEPYYLSDDRLSEEKELNAIAEITTDLLQRDSTKCSFKPLLVVKTSNVDKDPLITNAYNKLKSMMGSQYDWLARFSKKHHGIELSIHKDDKAVQVINSFGETIYIEDKVRGGYHILDKNKSSRELVKLFGNMRFPVMDRTKPQMRSMADKLGYSGIMLKTWFCHQPIGNEPCGKCNPCIYSIQEGMEFRFSKAALKRYERKTSATNKFLNSIKRIIFK